MAAPAPGDPAIGLLLGTFIAPERIPGTARLAEELGFDELWLAEDFFYTAGISAVTGALAATERIPVGTGIVSALVRHPALLAMEIATIAAMHPGRIRPGIGLGLPDWLRQMGLHPRSSLAAVGECVTAVRRLLAGEELTETGRAFSFDRVRLAYPPREPVPIYTGAVGPKMLELSGAIADGVILPVFAGAAYVRWARERIAAGRGDSGCRLVVFAFFSVDPDGRRAREAVRGLLGLYLFVSAGLEAMFAPYGIAERLRELAAGGAAAFERGIEERWVDDLAVVGDPEQCAAAIRRLLEAGADSVVLFPLPDDRTEEIMELAAREVLPRVR